MGETEKLKDFLFDTKKYGWEGLPDSVKNDIIKFSDEYIHFLNRSKTEREATSFITEILDKIKNTLGNYEYFYDVEGNFHF